MPSAFAGFPQGAYTDEQREVDIELHNKSLITYYEFIVAANTHKATL
jgi:hypothetical protein